MLQGNIDVARDLVALRDSLNQFIAPMRRVRVKQAHPEFAFDLLNLPKQRCERRPVSRIDRLARSCFHRPQTMAEIRMSWAVWLISSPPSVTSPVISGTHECR